MPSLWLTSGAILGFIGVAAGSFGAHGLKSLLEANGQAGNWETAVRYCLVHALAIMVVGIMSALPQAEGCRRIIAAAGWAHLTGTLIFSGFLAALAISGTRMLGAVVPIGGVLMLIGWGCLVAAGLTGAVKPGG